MGKSIHLVMQQSCNLQGRMMGMGRYAENFMIKSSTTTSSHVYKASFQFPNTVAVS